ncbi:hypothetical protein C7B80_03615 [Cyanosarcina cf. burmensis CCALA 770]|nr:hypothetical protein C7B80_03615 [Cyanosarcina cf. burmensis CCALA 770]
MNVEQASSLPQARSLLYKSFRTTIQLVSIILSRSHSSDRFRIFAIGESTCRSFPNCESRKNLA